MKNYNVFAEVRKFINMAHTSCNTVSIQGSVWVTVNSGIRMAYSGTWICPEPDIVSVKTREFIVAVPGRNKNKTGVLSQFPCKNSTGENFHLENG
jgi:hypothetical protein